MRCILGVCSWPKLGRGALNRCDTADPGALWVPETLSRRDFRATIRSRPHEIVVVDVTELSMSARADTHPFPASPPLVDTATQQPPAAASPSTAGTVRANALRADTVQAKLRLAVDQNDTCGSPKCGRAH